jgi:hypothetical protein
MLSSILAYDAAQALADLPKPTEAGFYVASATVNADGTYADNQVLAATEYTSFLMLPARPDNIEGSDMQSSTWSMIAPMVDGFTIGGTVKIADVYYECLDMRVDEGSKYMVCTLGRMTNNGK